MRGFGDIISTIVLLVPPWGIALLVAALAAVLGPGWYDSVKSKQIRSAVRAMAMAEPGPERDAHADRAWTLAAGRGSRLVTLVSEADKRRQDDLWARALRSLGAMPGYVDFVRAARKKRLGDKAPPRHPIEEAVLARRFIDEGMVDAARDRLDAALSRFPDDPDLLEARASLEGGPARDEVSGSRS